MLPFNILYGLTYEHGNTGESLASFLLLNYGAGTEDLLDEVFKIGYGTSSIYFWVHMYFEVEVVESRSLSKC